MNRFYAVAAFVIALIFAFAPATDAMAQLDQTGNHLWVINASSVSADATTTYTKAGLAFQGRLQQIQYVLPRVDTTVHTTAGGTDQISLIIEDDNTGHRTTLTLTASDGGNYIGTWEAGTASDYFLNGTYSLIGRWQFEEAKKTSFNIQYLY